MARIRNHWKGSSNGFLEFIKEEVELKGSNAVAEEIRQFEKRKETTGEK